ncbi:MAG: hypothetical protein JO359_10415 [Candidatus Eremiobacteraeota bacterium]|nr:hypothetical protein [Candidatus Eremiobacteraeota bacterium]
MIVVTATRFEAFAARRELRSARLARVGVGKGLRSEETLVSCGLAGGLRDDLATGTVLVPREVQRPSGERVACDPELVERLAAASRTLGLEPRSEPLVTRTTLVRGAERARWAQCGFAGVDMETGSLVAPRLAAVRVVLDTPKRELDWRALWVPAEAWRCARLAARVIAIAFPPPELDDA